MLVVTSLPKSRLLRLVLQTIGAVLLFGLGVEVGTKVSLQRKNFWSDAYSAADAETFRTYLVAQSSRGTAAQHEEALAAYIAMLKRQDSHPTQIYVGYVSAVHEMLAYAELSKLARERGNTAAAASNLEAAQTLCRERVHWATCSPDDIAAMRSRLEELRKHSVY
jgi:hypothetical protein